MIGNYNKISIIGRGATGEVWLCERDGKKYALKVVAPEVMRSDEDFVLAMLGNEMDLGEKLKHPNIAETIESQINDDSVFSVMEYADGGNLEKYCSQESLLPIDTLIGHARSIAKAMGFASSSFGLVHCDLKPSNILLFGDTVKVADFGASIQRSQAPRNDMRAGSPPYMSPEQIQGLELTPVSDIYSFGVLLYQLATGRLPFFSSTPEDAFHQTLNADIPAPSLFRVEIHPDLEAVIMKCLQRRQAARYQSWADVGLALAMVAQEIERAQIPWLDRRPIFDSISKSAFFQDFGERQTWELLQASKVITVKDGQRVVHKNERNQTIYFIVDGSFIVESGGRTVAVLRAGEVFGEMPYLIGGKDISRTANVTVDKHGTLMMVSPQALEAMSLECRYQLMRSFGRTLAMRLQAQGGEL